MTKGLKRALFIFAGLAFSVIALTLFLPTLFETEAGKKIAVSWINKDLPGQFSIESLDLGWFKSQKIRGVTYSNKESSVSVNIQELNLSDSLLSLILKGGINGSVLIENIEAEISDKTGPGSVNKPLMIKGGQVKLESQDKENGYSIVGSARLFDGEKDQEFSINGLIPSTLHNAISEEVHLDIVNLPSALIDWVISLSSGTESKSAESLFGKQLNIALRQPSKTPSSPVLLTIDSQNVKGKLEFTLDNSRANLEGTGSLTLKASPHLIIEAFRQTGSDPLFTLSQNTEAKATLQRLKLPLKKKTIDTLREADVELVLAIGPAHFTLKGESQGINLKQFLETIRLKDGSLSTDTLILLQAGQGETTIAAKAEATPLLGKKGVDGFRQLKLDMKAQGLPLDFLAALGGSQSSLFNGDKADIEASLNYHEDVGQLTLSIHSNSLELDQLNVNIGDEIALQRPAHIRAQVNATALHPFLPKSYTLGGGSILTTGTIEALRMPFKERSASNLKDILAAAVFKFRGDFQGPLTVAQDKTSLTVQDGKITLEGKNRANISFDMESNLLTGLQAPYSNLLHGPLKASAKGKITLPKDEAIALSEVLLQAESESLKFNSLISISGSKVKLITPATLKMDINPNALSQFDFSKDGSFNLKKQTSFTVSLTPVYGALDLNELMKSDLSGSIRAEEVDFFSRGNEIILKEINIPIELAQDEGKLKLSPSLKSYIPKLNKEGSVAAKVTVKDWQKALAGKLSQSQVKTRVQLMDFPTEILSLIASGDLPALLGPVFSLDVETVYQETLDINASLEGEALSGQLAIRTDNQLQPLKDNTSAKLQIAITQRRMDLLSAFFKSEEKSAIRLADAPSLVLTINSVELPGFDPASPPWNSLSKAAFAANLEIDRLSFSDLRRKQAVHLKKISAAVETDNIGKSLKFNLKAIPHDGDQSQGTLLAKGVVINALNENGSFDKESVALDVSISAHAFKTASLCDLACPSSTVSTKLEALLGDPIDSDIRLQIRKKEGPVFATIQGANGSIKLNGFLKDGHLFLNEPLVATVRATPALGTHVLNDIAPFLKGLESSSEPLKFTIQKEGFSFPLLAYDIADIRVKEASLETGKMIFKNSPELSSLISMLKGQQKEHESIWLTPLYFSMKEGKVKLKRADMLLSDSYHLASWGSVDLVNERVDMIIGVASDTITKTLGIIGLKKEFMLQIPFRGPLSNPKIDKTKAAAKISSLVASKQGPEGIIIGTFIDLASGGLMEPDAPPATTNPLPWAGTISEAEPVSSEQAQTETRTKIINPATEIEKGTKKLIRKLFQ